MRPFQPTLPVWEGIIPYEISGVYPPPETRPPNKRYLNLLMKFLNILYTLYFTFVDNLFILKLEESNEILSYKMPNT